MWFLFALLSAVFASVRRVNEKRLAQTLHHFTVGWLIQGLSLPVIGAAMLFGRQWLDPFRLGWAFWLPVLVIWVGFYPLNTYCYVNAYKHGEFSKILPLQSLAPVFSLGLSWLFLHEVPSLQAIVAIAVIACGVYVLNLKGKRLHNPLHMFSRDRANLLMLATIALAAVAGLLDAVAIRASNALMYSFISTLGAVPVLYLMARLSGAGDWPLVRRHITSLLTAGSLFGGSYTTYLLAIASGPLAYVSATRSSSMFIGAIIGIIWLHERLTVQKIIAGVCMIIGLVLLVAG